MRIACLWVPDFPLQALRRSAPELAETPLAVAGGPLPRDPLVAVSAEAASLGVRPGMTAAQARQVAPATLVRTTPAAVAAAADEALADVAAGFSPRLRRHLPGEVLLDVGGLLPRFDREETIAHELLRRCRRVGLEARAGIASNVGVARVAARCAERWAGLAPAILPNSGSHRGSMDTPGLLRRPARGGTPRNDGDSEEGRMGRPRIDPAGVGAGLAPARHGDDVAAVRTVNVGAELAPALCGDVAVVRAGEERAFMAPLPLEALEPVPELETMLARWGLAAAGELARLPRREVGLRLGPGGVALHRLASGEETDAFVPDPIREVLREGVELDDALATLEPFLFVANGILARLAQRLELRGEGFAEVLLELRLEGGERREHRLKLVAPTRDVPAVLALARLQLEARPPGAPVEGVTALATPGRVRLAQGSLFGPPLPAPGKLSTTLARLAALVGPERVGAPAVPDTHRPGAWALAPFELPVGITAAEGQRPFKGSQVRTFEGSARTVKSEELRVKSCEIPSATAVGRFEGSTAEGKREKGKGEREDEEASSQVRTFEGSARTVKSEELRVKSCEVSDRTAVRTFEGSETGAEGHNNENRVPCSCSSAPLPLCSSAATKPATSPVSPATGHRPLATPHPILRAFRPPREAKVDAVNGRPVVVWVEALGGIVVAWAGPYRFVGEWWGDEPFAREDFDVATTDGSLLRVYFDRLERRWFVDGIYD